MDSTQNKVYPEMTGRISEISLEENYIIVMQGEDVYSAIRFNIAPETVIRSRFGFRIPLSKLKPGMKVYVKYADFMTMSIPPQTNPFTIRVVK